MPQTKCRETQRRIKPRPRSQVPFRPRRRIFWDG